MHVRGACVPVCVHVCVHVCVSIGVYFYVYVCMHACRGCVPAHVCLNFCVCIGVYVVMCDCACVSVHAYTCFVVISPMIQTLSTLTVLAPKPLLTSCPYLSQVLAEKTAQICEVVLGVMDNEQFANTVVGRR